MPPLDAELAFLQSATQAPDADVLSHQLITSPLLTYGALKNRAGDFPSRGLLGTSKGDRVYANTNAPSSTVICGVQGSGKSHTVSCLLESALIADSRIGTLPAPLSALVFHFDAQETGRPCEAAFLSAPSVHGAAVPRVTVLCSPSNVKRRRRAYASLSQVRVEPLFLSESDLTAGRMLALMGCDNLETMPLYMHTALLIIRNMGVDAFSYSEFKRTIAGEQLDAKQRAMIKLRMDLLDAFINPEAPDIQSYFDPGGLVLVDLTDPFLDGLTAAVLFDTVLGVFTQWETACGKLVVLDEAHKYLVPDDAARLTQSVINAIRLQRHLALRVVIATQEPTVVPATILALASTIVCHRFSSPAWCAHLARHVSAGSDAAWYAEAMALATGDALVFAPAALMTAGAGEKGGVGLGLLGKAHFRLRVRPRLTRDGGASVLAVPPTPTPPVSKPRLKEGGVAPPTAPPKAKSKPAKSPAPPGARSSTAATPKQSATPKPPARAVPPHLKPLVAWLKSSGAADAPVAIGTAPDALVSVGRSHYAGMSRRAWWKKMLKDAAAEGLVELIGMNVPKSVLEGSGETRMVRLLRG